MERLSLSGRYTLVTGASAGLGREMAREIARRYQGNLVLVARRRELLEELAKELEPLGTKSVCIAADLSKPEDVERVFREATDGRVVHAAILNAGVTYFGHHLDLPEADVRAMLNINVMSTVKLANQLLQHQLAQSPGGGVMVISSMTGNGATPYQSLYAGTKAFLNQWGVSFATELQGKGVSMTVLSPGGLNTDMSEKAGLAKVYKKGSIFMMDPDRVARIALRAFVARRRYVIPGLLFWALEALNRLSPRILTAFVMKIAMGLALPSGDKSSSTHAAPDGDRKSA